IMSSRQATTDILKKLDEVLTHPRAREALAKQIEFGEKYVKGQEELLQLIQARDDAGAKAYLANRLRPVLGAFKKATVDQLDIQRELSAEVAKQARNTYASTLTLMIVLGAFVLAGAGLLAWWITRSIV